jgi:hypothetical protein
MATMARPTPTGTACPGMLMKICPKKGISVASRLRHEER